MATLYKRATLSQIRVLRIIEGAIKNANHVHPDRMVPTYMARSIAKRAAGTLTAEWPDVLAARRSRRSGRMHGQISNRHPQDVQLTERLGRGASQPGYRRSPLQKIWKALASEIGVAKRAGKLEKMAALIYAIKIVDAIHKIECGACV